ncbi:MAG: hypothetical protein LKE54_06900 [Prevotella sp.]|jgi:hypothetical protein|nr:hypothetical protein [Prevotella sp.]MCH3994760.1 hypothetical protein [Prevotella sp.]
MARNPLWSDEYWLLLMQLYLKKPVGVKPLYSKGLVDLSLELHISPCYLHEQMTRLQLLDTPRIEQLWKKYGKSPKKLSHEVKLLKTMDGFNHAEKFYEGVEIHESFEKLFEPLETNPELTPVKLILILNLYFHLIPLTMVKETPEIVDLSKLIQVEPELIVEVMDVFLYCDPCLKHDDIMVNPLLGPCQKIWQRYGNGNIKELSNLSKELRYYFY